MSTIKNMFLLTVLFFSTTLLSQEKKESIIVFFDKALGDIKYVDKNLITFTLKENDSIKSTTRHLLTFSYDKKNYKKSFCLKKLKIIPIKGLKAIKKVDEYLEKKALECEKISKDNTHCRLIRNPSSYYYNNYFKIIYVYEKIDEENGVLYKVDWIWGVN